MLDCLCHGSLGLPGWFLPGARGRALWCLWAPVISGSCTRSGRRGKAAHLRDSVARQRCRRRWPSRRAAWRERRGAGTLEESQSCCSWPQNLCSTAAAPNTTRWSASTASPPARRPASCSDGPPQRSRPASWPPPRIWSPPGP